MTAPSKLQVQEALVTLARASGMMEAFGNNGQLIGAPLASDCTKMSGELNSALETLRSAASAQ